MTENTLKAYYTKEPLTSISKDIIFYTSNIERGSVIVSLLNSIKDDKKLLSSLGEILTELKKV